MVWGKFVGGLCGYFLGARFGGLVGFFTMLLGAYIGDAFDQGLKHASRAWSFLTVGNKTREDFFATTFIIMGHIAKMDGRVSEDEIATARNIMLRFGLDEKQKLEAMTLFNKGKDKNFRWQEQLENLQKSCLKAREILQIFIELQIEIAYADGNIKNTKRELLIVMSEKLGFSVFEFSRLESMFLASRNFNYSQFKYKYENINSSSYQRSYYKNNYNNYSHSHQNDKQRLQDAYAILGVKTTASDREVKSAYRKLMSQHHPDKLVSKGLPEEMMKLATEKTQKIKSAYEKIMNARKNVN